MSKKEQVFENITNQIITKLEEGVQGGWKCPWDRMTSVATNAKTGKRLVGISQLLCYLSMIEYGFEVNRWLTMKQANELGGKIIKGSKSTLVFWLRPFIEIEVDGKKKLKSPEQSELQQAIEDGREVIWSYQFAPYFNVEQIDHLPDEYYEPVGRCSLSGLGDEFKPVAEAEAFIQLLMNSKDPLVLKHQGNQAYYSPKEDSVTLPERGKFHSEEAYYSTLLHEAGHWTGAHSRLNRPGIAEFDSFGSTQYAFEELVAELTATFKAAEMGLEREIREDHVKYIASWIEVLKKDSKAIFKASQEAMKAVRLMNDLADYQLDLFKIEQAA
jgi:antirestriction protein ArdC